MKTVGCDLHTRYQQIAIVDTETGELTERRLEHESGAGGPHNRRWQNLNPDIGCPTRASFACVGIGALVWSTAFYYGEIYLGHPPHPPGGLREEQQGIQAMTSLTKAPEAGAACPRGGAVFVAIRAAFAISLLLHFDAPLADAIGLWEWSRYQASSAEIRFREELSGRGVKGEGIEVSFTNYRSNDGTLVRRNVETCRSDGQALREFKNTLASSSKVLERGTKVDRGSNQVGERAVLRRRNAGPGRMRWVIAWTQGDVLYVLESNSLKHLRAFEEQVYPSGGSRR